MKRTLTLATGMAVLSGAIYLGSTLSAQQPNVQTAPVAQTPAAAPKTKIALINLNYVVKNYAKFIAFQGEMKAVLAKYQEADKSIGTQFEAKTKELQNPQLTAPQKAQIEQDLTKLKRDREDNSLNGKKMISERSDQGMVTFYYEVATAAKGYARARDIDLVMHYNDGLDQTEMWSPTNVARKLQAGACIPIDFAPGMDISPQIVQMLNTAYQNGQRPAATGATAAPATTPTGAAAPVH